MPPDTINIIDKTSTITIAQGGPQGSAGIGLPAGGAVGQVPAKASVNDFDIEWITNSATVVDIGAIGNVTIVGASSGDLLAWSGAAWVNLSLSEAGIATAAQSVPAGGSQGQVLTKASGSDNDTEWANAGSGSVSFVGLTDTPGSIGAESFVRGNAGGTALEFSLIEITDVVGLQSELDIRPELISGELGPGVDLGSLADVTITSVASGEVVVWDGTEWVNQTLTEAGVASASHTHTLANITDAGTAAAADTGDFAAASHTHTLANITDAGTAAAADTGDFAAASHTHTLANITDAGTAAAANTGDFAAASHTHAASEVASGEFADARISESSVTQHEAALVIAQSQVSGVRGSKSISIPDPVANDDVSMFFTDRAITISKMVAVLLGSATPSVTWTIRHSTDRSGAGSEVVTGGTTTTNITTGIVITSFNDATIPANSFVWIEITAQSGTVTEMHTTLMYTED